MITASRLLYYQQPAQLRALNVERLNFGKAESHRSKFMILDRLS